MSRRLALQSALITLLGLPLVGGAWAKPPATIKLPPTQIGTVGDC